ncbi:hypothetical protein Q8F55_001387 [Vanrija albida]|uniref:Phosphoribulokinase/uridine kinase domain-containing protein n=1 Tax=Vanrija albida TaxID=181172 RepID=A0ABR3QGD2_9TREE
MGADVERLAQDIIAQYRRLAPDRRLLIAVAGRPGSGKSTLAYPLADHLNELILGHPVARAPINAATAVASPPAQRADDDVAICVGQDGWHYTRAQLDLFPDPEAAHWRRGAAFTFDLGSYAAFVEALRVPLEAAAPIPFPTFDHKLKDPRPSPTPILPRHRIVVVEGLYTMLDEPGWREPAALMDRRVWVEVPRDVVFRRVLKRNTEAGIVSLELAEKRVNQSDMVNGDDVYAHRFEVTDTIYPADVPQ